MGLLSCDSFVVGENPRKNLRRTGSSYSGMRSDLIEARSFQSHEICILAMSTQADQRSGFINYLFSVMMICVNFGHLLNYADWSPLKFNR
jgi:hypothetical protein